MSGTSVPCKCGDAEWVIKVRHDTYEGCVTLVECTYAEDEGDRPEIDVPLDAIDELIDAIRAHQKSAQK